MRTSGLIKCAALALLAISASIGSEAKSAYDKLLSKKGVEKLQGSLTLYRDADKLWLELPDSLLGREVMLNTFLTATTGGVDPWQEVSADRVYRFCRTDSLLIMKRVSHPLDIAPEVVDLAFPIKYRSNDSLAVVADIAGMLDLSRKDVCSVTGSLGGLTSILSSKYNKEKSCFMGMSEFGSSVAMSYQALLTLNCSLMGYSTEQDITADVTTMLTLLPESSLEQKEVRGAKGVLSTSVPVYDEDRGLVTKKYARRFNLNQDRVIKVYVDTLLPAEISAAAKHAVEAWNEAFESAGMGRRIQVLDFAADMNALDPLVSVVKASGGKGTDPSAIRIMRPDGEILSFRMNIPDGLQEGIGQNGTFCIADVDSRFANHDIPLDAIADVLKSRMLGLVGQCIGLLPNAAGSYAYSPQQLRDPVFTAEHGFTSSVTDDVVFNYIARPGDMERGVKIYSDRVGEYDRAAVAYLYADCDDALASQLYLQRKTPAEDSRCAIGALGNDILEAYSARISHVKYAAEHFMEWYSDYADVGVDMEVLPERIWMEWYRASNMLACSMGGLMLNEVWDSPDSPAKIEVVSAQVQKNATEALLRGIEEFEWFDGNEELFNATGANKNSVFMRYSNSLNALGLTRIPQILYAEECGSGYTAKQHMERIQKFYLSHLSEKDFAMDMDKVVLQYLNVLISMSPVTVSNYKAATSGNSLYEELEYVEAAPSASGAVAAKQYEAQLLCYNMLQDAEKQLKIAASRCIDNTTKAKISYLAHVAEMALNGKQ